MKNTEIGNNTEAYDDIVAACREIYRDINRIKSGEFSLEKGHNITQTVHRSYGRLPYSNKSIRNSYKY